MQHIKIYIYIYIYYIDILYKFIFPLLYYYITRLTNNKVKIGFRVWNDKTLLCNIVEQWVGHEFAIKPFQRQLTKRNKAITTWGVCEKRARKSERENEI